MNRNMIVLKSFASICVLVSASAVMSGCGTTPGGGCPAGQELVNGQCVDSSSGACCLGDSCNDTTSDLCDTLSGAFHPGTNCGDLSCNPTNQNQPCCHDGTCTEELFTDCINMGGYIADGTTCGDSTNCGA